MIKITSEVHYKNDKSVLFLEEDKLKMLEDELNGIHRRSYRIYLDREISYQQAVEFLEECECQELYFTSAHLLDYLITEKMLSKSILAPLSIRDLTNREANAILNYVDHYVSEDNLNEPYQKCNKQFKTVELEEQLSTVTEKLVIYDILTTNDGVEVIFNLNKHYDTSLLTIESLGKSIPFKQYQDYQAPTKPEDQLYSFTIYSSHKAPITAKYLNVILRFEPQAISKSKKGLYNFGKIYIKLSNKQMQVFPKFSVRNKLRQELRYQRTINRTAKIGRLKIILSKQFVSNNRILISDDAVVNESLGLDFYQYLVNQGHKNIYYLAEPDTPVFSQLLKQGLNVVAKGSFKHKLYVYCNKIIFTSSHKISSFHYLTPAEYQKYSDMNSGQIIYIDREQYTEDNERLYKYLANKYLH